VNSVILVVTSLLAWVQKYAGHAVPERWVSGARVSRITALLPVALLAALIAVSALTTAGSVSLDARLAGLAAAFVALILRAPFLLVLLVAAATAAGLRAAGLAS
jgi:hypothetical protein